MEINKMIDLSEVFGALRDKENISGQEFKDIARDGWD